MALTQDFRTRVVQRIQSDPEFARELLHEALTLILNGDDAGKLILRDLVNATVGFEKLAVEIHKPSKSLHRMLSKNGNPTMDYTKVTEPEGKGGDDYGFVQARVEIDF